MSNAKSAPGHRKCRRCHIVRRVEEFPESKGGHRCAQICTFCKDAEPEAPNKTTAKFNYHASDELRTAMREFLALF